MPIRILRNTLFALSITVSAAACGDLSGGNTGAPADANSTATTESTTPTTTGAVSTTTTGGAGTTTAGTTGGTGTAGTTGGTSTTGTTGGMVDGMACPTYADFAQNFFTTTCSKCHNATSKEPNFQDLPTVLKDIDDNGNEKGIKSRIDSGDMPQGGPRVTGTTLTKIDAWMDPNCRK